MVDPLSLTVDACLAAVADAGLTLDDIDGLSTYPGAVRRRDERGRRDGGRGGAAHPSDVAQRRGRSAGSGRIRHRRHDGRGHPACAVTCSCFRTVWESTYRQLGLGRAPGRVSGA